MLPASRNRVGRTRRGGARLTIRWKMALGILISFVLLLPVVGVSLYYLRGILEEERKVTEVLAPRQEAARRILGELDALREAEVQYLITRDSNARDALRSHLASLREISSRNLPGEEGHRLEPRAVLAPLGRYEKNLAPLVRIIEVEESVDPYRDVEGNVRRFREELDRLLSRAGREKDPVARQELFRQARDFLRSFETAFLEIETGRDPQKAQLVRRMQEARGEARRLAERIEGESAGEIREQRVRIATLSNRARRNIFTSMLVTALLGLSWVLVLPRRITTSIHRITNVLRQAKHGNLDLPRVPEGHDEVGELAEHLNRFIREVRVFDRLKTDRIQEGENRLKALAASVDDLILFVNDAYEVTFANDRTLSTLGWNRDRSRPEALKAISSHPELQAVFREALEKGKEINGKIVRIPTTEEESAHFRVSCGLVRDGSGDVRQILIALKPAPAGART